MNRGKQIVVWISLILILGISSQISSSSTAMAAVHRSSDLGPMPGVTERLSQSVSSPSTGTYYYVDSAYGSDSNPGTSQQEPWRTLQAVNWHDFQPGDTIHFKRGGSWTGHLVVNDSGTESNPITFTAYGSGDKPKLSNPDAAPEAWQCAIDVYASWIVIEDLFIHDTIRDGVRLYGEYCTLDNLEITDTGGGVSVGGTDNQVTHCYIHDLNMILNTPDGGWDDYGATGVTLLDDAARNEIAWCRFERCTAPSYDFGTDGGVIEMWKTGAGNYIHHNWAQDCDGFVECYRQDSAISDTILAYNVSIDNGRFMLVNGGTVMKNLRIENNTIIERKPHAWARHILHLDEWVDKDEYLIRNNIFYMDGWSFAYLTEGGGLTHEHNLYWVVGDGSLGITPDPSEQVADPLFVSPDRQDFHLQSSSPAIDAGIDAGYLLDFDSKSVPIGAAPDIGAFESRMRRPELIIDDTDNGFSIQSSSYVDGWQEHTDPYGQHYGSSHRFNAKIGAGEDVAGWSFTVPVSGTYQVYAWWWEGSWRPADVPYAINHLDGSTTVKVNQQTNGGQWNLLGTFDFRDEGWVTVSDAASSGSDIVADAIRLVYVWPHSMYLPIVACNHR